MIGVNIDLRFKNEEEARSEMQRITDFICERTSAEYLGWDLKEEEI